MRDCTIVTVLGRKDPRRTAAGPTRTPPIFGTAANSGELSERGAGVVKMAVEDRRLDQPACRSRLSPLAAEIRGAAGATSRLPSPAPAPRPRPVSWSGHVSARLR